MNGKINIFFVSAVAVFILSCHEKEESMTTRSYPFKALSDLNIKSDIHVEFIQDSLNEIIMFAREKMHDGVVPEIFGDTIVLINTNTSSPFHKYENEVKAEVHFTSLRYLFFQGGGNLSNRDTIRLKNFILATNQSNGNVNLIVKSDNVHVGLSTGSSEVKISGMSKRLSLWSTSYCKVHMENLIADEVSVRNNSAVDHYVYATDKLTSSAQYFGNIFYSGNPSDIVINDTGAGKTQFWIR